MCQPVVSPFRLADLHDQYRAAVRCRLEVAIAVVKVTEVSVQFPYRLACGRVNLGEEQVGRVAVAAAVVGSLDVGPAFILQVLASP